MFIVLARRELAHHGQPTDPGLPTSKLVTTGVFSVSRNPLYLAAFAFWQGLRWCSIFRGHWFFSSRPSSPATIFS